MVALSIAKTCHLKLFPLFIHLLAIDQLSHNFKLKLLSSTLCLIILDAIFSI